MCLVKQKKTTKKCYNYTSTSDEVYEESDNDDTNEGDNDDDFRNLPIF